MIALPLGIAARVASALPAGPGGHRRALHHPVARGVRLPPPVLGLRGITALVPLTTYTLLILLRNVVAGLDPVPPEVKDSADGMGYTPFERLVRIELPLAMPAILAGIRIATVTMVGLAAVAGLLAIPNLGKLILTVATARSAPPSPSASPCPSRWPSSPTSCCS